ncbi:PREDICTED: calcyphosin-2-like [Pygoscelis adeliae]|uniref:calcyphosin-2-like n=1 Tax=Pygoscelis adeliae TaxID=9238 RepID=UPI0004F4FEF5|nr:PREDICTED: calcyphosin-2-like [Pygoscelis adeliae]
MNIQSFSLTTWLETRYTGYSWSSPARDGDSYIPYSGSYPHTCPLDSSSDWGTSLQTPYAQYHQAQQHSVLEQKTVPENLLSPTDRYKLKYRQYEADMKEEYKQYSQRIAEKRKDHLQCPEASIKVAGKEVIAFLEIKYMLVFGEVCMCV